MGCQSSKEGSAHLSPRSSARVAPLSNRRIIPPGLPRSLSVAASCLNTLEDVRRPEKSSAVKLEHILQVLQEGGDASSLQVSTFCHGFTRDALPAGWAWLLTNSSLAAVRERKSEFDDRKAKCAEMMERVAGDMSHPLFQAVRVIDNDVPRTDMGTPRGSSNASHRESLRDILMCYAHHDPDVGYSQGMSDIVAVLLKVFNYEAATTYWVFEALMGRWRTTFLLDREGVSKSMSMAGDIIKARAPALMAHFISINGGGEGALIFMFRWLLLYWRRDFPEPEVIRLWTMLWSCPFANDNASGAQFHHYIAASIVLQHQGVLQKKKFDDVVMFVNGLSYKLPLTSIVIHALNLYLDLETAAAQSTRTARNAGNTV